MNTDDELKQWQQQWQQAPAIELDAAALVANARRQALREKIVATFEILGAAGASLLCVIAAALPGIHVAERTVFVLLALLVAGFSTWAIRQRRRNWQEVATDASAQIDAERKRLQRRVTYWRANAWIVSGLWLMLVAFAGIGWFVDARGAEGWLVSAAINAIVVIATLVWAHVVRRRVARRMVELDVLETGG